MASVFELEVTAGAAEGQFTVRVVRSIAGVASTATMHLDTTSYVSARDDLETVVLASAATSRRILTPGEQRLRGVGQQLFEALFSGPVYEAYRASVSAADAGGERLRLVLQLDAPELAAIPWEAMYDPGNDEYICRADPLIRQIPSATPEPLEVASPLEVLVLVASPDGMMALDVEAERTRLSEALAEPIADGRIHLKWLMQASWAEVQDEMLSGTWHVLHFIGHGDYDPGSEQGVIALVGDDRGPNLVEADRLADLLNQAAPTPRLVVLNSCQSGKSGTRDLFSSTAATLVRRGIGAVAAMQFPVSDAGAIKFARGFYSALASGRSVGDAIGSGRVGLLSSAGSLEWVTPVLYVRGDAATLFRISSPPRQSTQTAPPQSAQPSRKGFSTGALVAAGGIAVAILTVVVIWLVNVISSTQEPSLSTPAHSSTASPAGSTDSAPARDPDTVIQELNDVGVDYSIPRAALVGYLNNQEFTAYPSLAAALLTLLSDRGLRLPVYLDVIVFNYEASPGNPSPRRVEDVDIAVLKAAVLEGFNNRHGEEDTDFQSLLAPIG
ncbi:MAG: CHAT domain-containing protein [Candidatus Sericytochromatia bacterium]